MSEENLTRFLNNPENTDFLNDVRSEILSGTAGVEEHAEDLVEYPENYANVEGWEELLDECDGEDEEFELAERLVRALWNELADQTRAWEGQTTDHDRLQAAIQDLHSKDIMVHEFSDWGSVDEDPSDPGTVLIPIECAKELTLGRVEIQMSFRAPGGDANALGRTIVDTLTRYELHTEWDSERGNLITVNLEWRPHIDAVSLDPDSWGTDDDNDADGDYENAEAAPREDNSWFYALFDEDMANWARLYLEKDGEFFEARIRSSHTAIIRGAVGGESTVKKSRLDALESLDNVKAAARELVDHGWTRPEGTPDAELPPRGLGV